MVTGASVPTANAGKGQCLAQTMFGTVTITKGLWSVAFQVLFFYSVAAVILVAILWLVIAALARGRRPHRTKPAKLMPPRIVRVE